MFWPFPTNPAVTVVKNWYFRETKAKQTTDCYCGVNVFIIHIQSANCYAPYYHNSIGEVFSFFDEERSSVTYHLDSSIAECRVALSWWVLCLRVPPLVIVTRRDARKTTNYCGEHATRHRQRHTRGPWKMTFARCQGYEPYSILECSNADQKPQFLHHLVRDSPSWPAHCPFEVLWSGSTSQTRDKWLWFQL